MTDKPLLAARKHSERPHVLIISDDVSLATFLNEGLPLGGFWTTIIASGLQALEIFRLRQYDLIVIDYALQSFDVLELTRRLRGKSTRARDTNVRTTAPIIYISEEPIELEAELRDELGIARLLHAPLELDDVAVELHGAFESWRENNPTLPMSDDPTRGTHQGVSV